MKQRQVDNNQSRRHGSKNTSQELSKQEVTRKASSNLYWGFKERCQHSEAAGEDLCASLSLGEENHLATLKKLREKALRYTSQLDEIRGATKKREKELTDVMERLQMEKENVDQLSYKITMRRKQLRHDHLVLRREENGMAERLQALKEKEIFLNCQMVKLQSQEQAIKYRRRELNKEKLRIEKLAYLIFETDLSTMTYKEFHSRIGKMQNQLERKYRKVKLFEHYCQNNTLPRGMQLEPMTPIEQTLDPAVAAFKEALWGKNPDIMDSSSTKLFAGDDSKNKLEPSFDYNRYLDSLEKEESQSEKYKRKLAKEQKIIKKTSFKAKALGKDGRLAFFQSQQSSLTTTTVYETDSAGGTRVNPIEQQSGAKLSLESSQSGHRGGNRSSKDQSQSTLGVSSSLTLTKKSKSEQEGQIVKEASHNIQRLVMSAKETCASAHRLLQTPIPCVEEEDEDEDKENRDRHPKDRRQRQIRKHSSRNRPATGSYQSQPDEDFLQEESESGPDVENRNSKIESEDSFLSDIPEEEMAERESTNSDCEDILDETEVIHRRISKQHDNCDYLDRNSSRLSHKTSNDMASSRSSTSHYDDPVKKRVINWSTISKDHPHIDENGVCSIFRNSRNDDDKISSQSLIHPHSSTKCLVPFRFRRKKPSEESIKDEEVSQGSDHFLHPPTHKNKRNSFTKSSPHNNDSRRRASDCSNKEYQGGSSPHHRNNGSHSSQNNRVIKSTYRKPPLTDQDQSSADKISHSHCDPNNQYDDLVKDRLSRLSEATRNEIVYAIGQKALAHVAQAVDNVSKYLIIDSQPSKHGDQIHPANHKEEDGRHQILRVEYRTGSGRSGPDPYLQMVRRGIQTPVRKGPRKIPSHLKFGNFNIRHRRRGSNNNNTSNTYRPAQQPPASHQQNPEQQKQQRPPATFHSTECPSSSLFMGNTDNKSGTKSVKSNVDSCSNSNNQSSNSGPICGDFPPDPNYAVGIVAEKILGIPSRRRDLNNNNPNCVVPKLSHSRAFRV